MPQSALAIAPAPDDAEAVLQAAIEAENVAQREHAAASEALTMCPRPRFGGVSTDYQQAAHRFEATQRAHTEAIAAVTRARQLLAESATEEQRRAELREAIDEVAKTGKAIEAARAAEERATDLVAAATKALQEAAAASDAARKQHELDVEEAATTGNTPAKSSLRESRARETDAADDLDAAKASLDKQQAKLVDLEEAHAETREKLPALVCAVIRSSPSIMATLAAAQLLQDTLIGYRLLLRHLAHEDLIHVSERDEVRSFLQERTLPGAPNDIEYKQWNDGEIVEQVDIARHELERRADAPLPDVTEILRVCGVIDRPSAGAE